MNLRPGCPKLEDMGQPFDYQGGVGSFHFLTDDNTDSTGRRVKTGELQYANRP